MARYCLPSLNASHSPPAGHHTSKHLDCSLDEFSKPEPCNQGEAIKNLICVPGCSSFSRYSICDWEKAYQKTHSTAERERLNAEQIRSNTWCLVKVNEKHLHDRQCSNTRKLGERICDIAFWKEQLLREIQLMETENDNLTEFIRVLQRTLCETKLPLSIIEECLMQREKRVGIECAHDEVEQTLCKEAEVIRSIQEKLKELIAKAQCQFRKNRAIQHDLDLDVRDKHHAQGIDDKAHQLRNGSCKVGFHPHAERVDNSVTTTETWTKYSQNSIARSMAEREVSETLRSDIDCFLRTAAKEMWNRYNQVNSALLARIQEITNARNRLQVQLEKTNNEIREQDRTIQLLRRTIREREEALKVAQTRLDERTRRRCVELCRDAAMLGMKKEIQEIYEAICQLKEKLRLIENALCLLLKTSASLELDIASKEKTIQIDSAFCLGLRKKMPMDPKIGPVLVKPPIQC